MLETIQLTKFSVQAIEDLKLIRAHNEDFNRAYDMAIDAALTMIRAGTIKNHWEPK